MGLLHRQAGTLFWFSAISLGLVFTAVPSANATLIWDITPGDGGTITNGDGTWADGGGNWNTGSGDTTWDNNAPDVAQFGTSRSSSSFYVTVDGLVKANGLINKYQVRYDYTEELEPTLGTIEFQGTDPEIQIDYHARFYSKLATATDVDTLYIKPGTEGTGYCYLYGNNEINAPLEIGVADGSSGLAVFCQSGTLYSSGPALNGDPDSPITVYLGSTLGIRSKTITGKDIILGGGTGYGGRGNLEFYSNSYDSDLQGDVTLTADATIDTRAIGRISGSLTGAHALTIVNAASNRVGAVTLTNATNSTDSVVVQGASAAPIWLILAENGNYTADTSVTLTSYGGAMVRGGSVLTAPVVNVNDTGTLLGQGSVVGAVVVASGGTLEAGDPTIYNATDDVYYMYGDNIGTLSITGDVTLGGTLEVEYDSDTGAIDLVNVSGELDLTGGTINFTDLGSSTLTGGPYVLATYGKLDGAPTVTGTIPAGYVLSYTYNGNSIALVPEPSSLILLALAGLVLAVYQRRRLEA
jgi:hypothetical protein